MECVHGLAAEWCSLCLGHSKPSKPRQSYGKAEFRYAVDHVPRKGRDADPLERIAAQVAAGVLCPKCLTPSTGRGCACSREAMHGADWADGADWLHAHAAELGERLQQNVARSTHARSARLRGHVQEEAEERANVMAEFGIQPRWVQPRRTEQNHLPI